MSIWDLAGDAIGAVGGVAGGVVGAIGSALGPKGAGGVGANSFRASDFADTDKYNKNAQYLGGKQGYAQQLGDQMGAIGGAADNRQFIQANYGNASQDRGMGLVTRGAQGNALGLMQSAALGQQPSVAQMQMQQGQSRALADQMSMAASQQQGPGSALAARGAMGNAANIQAATAANSSMLRAQEMENARGAYMQGALGMGGQDISRQGLDANMAQAQAQFGLQSQGQNDARSLAYRQMQSNYLQSEAQRAMANNAMLASTHGSADAINAGVNQSNADQEMKRMAAYSGMVQGAMQGGMSMAGSSGGSAGPGATAYAGGIPGAGAGAGSIPAGSGGGYSALGNSGAGMY